MPRPSRVILPSGKFYLFWTLTFWFFSIVMNLCLHMRRSQMADIEVAWKSWIRYDYRFLESNCGEQCLSWRFDDLCLHMNILHDYWGDMLGMITILSLIVTFRVEKPVMLNNFWVGFWWNVILRKETSLKVNDACFSMSGIVGVARTCWILRQVLQDQLWQIKQFEINLRLVMFSTQIYAGM